MTRLPDQDTADRYQRGLESMIAAGTRSERPPMTAEHTLRMLGDNVTLMRCAWIELLDELRPDSSLAIRIRTMLGIPVGKLARHCGHEFPIGAGEITAAGQPGVMLDDGTVVDFACGDHIQRILDRSLTPSQRGDRGRLNLRRDRTVVKGND